MEFIRSQVEQADRPGYKCKAYGKAIEPYKRSVDTDGEEIDDAKLNALIKELEPGWGDSKMREEDNDEMEVAPNQRKILSKHLQPERNLKLVKKHLIKYSIRAVCLPKTTPKDGIVKWNGETLPEEGENEETHGTRRRMKMGSTKIPRRV